MSQGAANMLRVVPAEEAIPHQPAIPLAPGENYRFHFDMSKCIGCKCCEVACHEQNNNPATVKWRQVGEVESGTFPDTRRFFTSIACNHCLEPTCLEGCPVDAYRKDPRTGVVVLNSDQCIGCQYCTWNCPYSAPQFNPARGVVTKCDLCHNRLADGDLPACVAACPSGAIEVEAFSPLRWRDDFSAANGPGLPDASITLSATRISVQAEYAGEVHRVDDAHLRPEKPHYSLILLTVLTQLSVGGFTSLLLLDWLHLAVTMPPALEGFFRIGPLAMVAVANLALGASVFHLGRPAYAIRAIRMWRRSWLSREVLLFSLFAGFATLYGALVWQSYWTVPGEFLIGLGALVVLSGLAGLYSSARIYCVPARPSWNTRRTPVAFFATAFLLGPLVALLVLLWSLTGEKVTFAESVAAIRSAGISLVGTLLLAGAVQLGGILLKLLGALSDAEIEPERVASARLLIGRFRPFFLARLGTLLLGLLLVPLALTMWHAEALERLAITVSVLAVLILLSEFTGRYLFFVTVVAKNRPEAYG